jgi:hypothetical protein
MMEFRDTVVPGFSKNQEGLTQRRRGAEKNFLSVSPRLCVRFMNNPGWMIYFRDPGHEKKHPRK